MGAPGPPGGFDAQKYTRGGQYAPQIHPSQGQGGHPATSGGFYSQPVPSAFPTASFAPSASVAPKSSSFPPLPGGGAMFNAANVPQGAGAIPNPFYFARDRGQGGGGYAGGGGAPGPLPVPKAGDFSLGGGGGSHPSPTASSAAGASVGQERGAVGVSSSPLDGARLMALLTTQSAAEGGGDGAAGSVVPELEVAASEGKFGGAKAPAMTMASAGTVASSTVPAGLPKALQDSKLPRGRVLQGERIVYDVDVRRADEAQPQLEVRSICAYGSDPEPILGRQIAVNKDFICYGLRGANIRIINPTAESKTLLRGHGERVTDMAFFAENVNKFASASTDGRVFVRLIVESRDKDGKPFIQDQIVAAVHFIGDWESTNPRICWQTQDTLLVAVGKYILSMDLKKLEKAGPAGVPTTEEPVVCEMKGLVEGVTLIGQHEEEVTDLAVPLYSQSHVASASADGSVRIWGPNGSGYVSSFVPHMGEVVGAVAFLSAPGFPEQSVLLTAGHQMNRELKLWAPEESASPSKSGNVMWECIQTVEFTSSAAGDDMETAFFNQVVVAPGANLIVVANAKKNAIYVVHVQFGGRGGRAQMKYLAEFSVTIPILSLMVREQRGSEGGQGAVVQIYCVQTLAIQQYSLLVSQCVPMSTEKSARQATGVVDKAAVKVVTSTAGSGGGGGGAAHFTPARGSTSRHKLKPTEIPPSAEPSSSSESLSPVSIRRTRAVRVDADSSPPPRWNPPVREDGSPLPPRRRTPPARQDDSPPLPHIRTPLAREDGDSPRPRSPNPRFLEANNSPPPHMKIPSTDDSDSPSPRIRPPTTLESSRNPPRRESSESSVRRSRFKPPDNDEENESSSRGRASFKTAEPKSANARRINYEVAEDDGEVLALEDGTFGTFMFEGSTVDELIEELRRKTKIDDIILCMRNNQKGTLFKMRLALPSNKAPLPVVVVRQNSSFGRKLSTR